MFPFNLPGPEFLLFYVVLVAVGAAAAIGLRSYLRQPAPAADDPPPDLSPQQIACLSGGRKLVIDTAIASLVQNGALKTNTEKRRLIHAGESAGARSPVESSVLIAASEYPEGATIAQLRRGAESAVSEVEQQLEEKGLRPGPAQSGLVRFLPLGVMALVVICGLIKIKVGLDLNRPVGFLIAMTAVTGAFSLFLLRKPATTRKGDTVLERLKQEHRTLETTARTYPDQLAPADWTMAWCLYGYPMLMISPWSPVYMMMQPPSMGGSGCGATTGGCGSGSGCGSGGDGGGGGGGCGGCGGGGGD